MAGTVHWPVQLLCMLAESQLEFGTLLTAIGRRACKEGRTSDACKAVNRLRETITEIAVLAPHLRFEDRQRVLDNLAQLRVSADRLKTNIELHLPEPS